MFVYYIMSNTVTDVLKFLQILKDTPKIYLPIDFNENITVELIQYIKDKYKSLIKQTLIETFTRFGDELIQYDPNADYEDEDLEFINKEYTVPFLNLPILWQEIIILLYFSLQIHRKVENNSRVVALGESPLKLVYIQQILITQPHFISILRDNNLATDVEYNYFPISKLSSFIISKHLEVNNIFNPRTDFNLDMFLETGVKYITDRVNDKVLEHFLLFKLDPLSIISDQHAKIYFQDRAEKYKTIIVLISFYDKMCDIQQLTLEQRLILYSKIFIIGFDTKPLSREVSEQIILERINNFFYQLITKDKNPVNKSEYHFIQQNYNIIDNGINRCLQNDFNLFTNQDNLLYKLIGFLTVPEMSYNNSRCIQSCPINNPTYGKSCTDEIKRNLEISGELHFKQTGVESENCNVINLCLMIFINELGPEYLSNMIQNIDKINLDQLFLNQTNFHDLNTLITQLVSEKVYNNNILNHMLMNKLIIEAVIKKIMEYIIQNGIFVPCRYVIPLQ